MKKIRWHLIFNMVVIISCVSLILYFIFSKDGLKDLIKSSESILWQWIAAALICHVANAFLDSVITWQLIRQKYKEFSFFNAVKAAVTGHFFSAVTPGSSGGQPMQMVSLKSCGVDLGFSTSILLQKFLVYQITSTVYAGVLFAFKSKFILSHIKGTLMTVFVIIGFATQLFVMLFVFFASFKPTVTKRLARLCANILKKFKIGKNHDKHIASIDAKINVFYNSNKRFFKQPLLMLKVFFEIVLQITCIYAVPYFIYRGLVPNGDGSPIIMFCAVAFVNVISSMIPIPGASGVSELAFSVFFGSFFTAGTLKSAVLIWRVITYYLTILVGAPFSIIRKRHGGEKYRGIADSSKQ